MENITDEADFHPPHVVTFEPPHSNTLRQCLQYGIKRARELERQVEIYPAGMEDSAFVCRPGDSVTDVLDNPSAILLP